MPLASMTVHNVRRRRLYPTLGHESATYTHEAAMPLVLTHHTPYEAAPPLVSRYVDMNRLHARGGDAACTHESHTI